MRPLPPEPDFSMYGSRWATAVFITSADCSTNGSCISPDPNRSPTVFMPASSVSLMISSGGRVSIAASRSASSPSRSPSTIRRSSRSDSGSAASSSARDSRDEDALTPSNSAGTLQRVVALAPAVVDHVERDLALLVLDLRHRQDLRRVHDRRVEPALTHSCRKPS
jgi:hypothetical protein